METKEIEEHTEHCIAIGNNIKSFFNSKDEALEKHVEKRSKEDSLSAGITSKSNVKSTKRKTMESSDSDQEPNMKPVKRSKTSNDLSGKLDLAAISDSNELISELSKTVKSQTNSFGSACDTNSDQTTKGMAPVKCKGSISDEEIDCSEESVEVEENKTKNCINENVKAERSNLELKTYVTGNKSDSVFNLEDERRTNKNVSMDSISISCSDSEIESISKKLETSKSKTSKGNISFEGSTDESSSKVLRKISRADSLESDSNSGTEPVLKNAKEQPRKQNLKKASIESSDSDEEMLVMVTEEKGINKPGGSDIDSETEFVANNFKQKAKGKSLHLSDSEDKLLEKPSKAKAVKKVLCKYDDASGDEYIGKVGKKAKNDCILSSDSNDEPISNLGRSKTLENKSHDLDIDKAGKQINNSKLKKSSIDSSDSEDESLSKFARGKTLKKKSCESDFDSECESVVKAGNKAKTVSIISSGSDDEPIAMLVGSKTIKKKKPGEDKFLTDSSDSDDEPLNQYSSSHTLLSKKPKERTVSGNKGKESSSDSDGDSSTLKSPVKHKKIKRKSVEKKLDSSQDSEDLVLSTKKNKSAKDSNKPDEDSCMTEKQKKSKQSKSIKEPSPVKSKGSEESANSSEEEKGIKLSKEPKSSQSTQESKSKIIKLKKAPTPSENKLEHLKKYVRAAGIRVQNYTKLFEESKTMKAKMEKLMDLLEKAGLKGKPTLQKCKKLKKRNETKKEIAELDLSNIIKTNGSRPKRSGSAATSSCQKRTEKSPTPEKKFFRLQGIVDSDESD